MTMIKRPRKDRGEFCKDKVEFTLRDALTHGSAEDNCLAQLKFHMAHDGVVYAEEGIVNLFTRLTPVKKRSIQKALPKLEEREYCVRVDEHTYIINDKAFTKSSKGHKYAVPKRQRKKLKQPDPNRVKTDGLILAAYMARAENWRKRGKDKTFIKRENMTASLKKRLDKMEQLFADKFDKALTDAEKRHAEVMRAFDYLLGHAQPEHARTALKLVHSVKAQ